MPLCKDWSTFVSCFWFFLVILSNLFVYIFLLHSLVSLAWTSVQHIVPSLGRSLVPVFCIICMRSLLVHTGEAGHLSPLHLASVIVVVLVIVLHIIHLYPLPTSVISNVIIVFIVFVIVIYLHGMHQVHADLQNVIVYTKCISILKLYYEIYIILYIIIFEIIHIIH